MSSEGLFDVFGVAENVQLLISGNLPVMYFSRQHGEVFSVRCHLGCGVFVTEVRGSLCAAGSGVVAVSSGLLPLALVSAFNPAENRCAN